MTTKITDKNISTIANRFIQWQSVITADGSTATNATAGQGYFIDTTSNTHTINLPSSPSIGDSIAIKDYAGTFATNNLTIGRNGNNIQGVANNSLITTNRASLTLVYIDSTKGWVYAKESNVADLEGPSFISATGGTITTSGDFKIHTFTGDGCFVVATVGNPIGSDSVDYLVVAGGGAGAKGRAGGGAGGYRTSFPGGTKITTPATTYPVTVGSGGSAPPGATPGASGTDSIFSTITSTGGGGGGGDPGTGLSGGSGGGGGGAGLNPAGAGGAGNSPPTSPPQGNPGGNAIFPSPFDSGGGGGASAAGVSGSAPGAAVNGGAGSTNLISGSPVAYAGGGGGANTLGTAGAGGLGGGGAGASNNSGTPGTPGTVNTGGGGGGGDSAGAGQPGGNGGSGIVIMRYKFQ